MGHALSRPPTARHPQKAGDPGRLLEGGLGCFHLWELKSLCEFKVVPIRVGSPGALVSELSRPRRGASPAAGRLVRPEGDVSSAPRF